MCNNISVINAIISGTQTLIVWKYSMYIKKSFRNSKIDGVRIRIKNLLAPLQ